MNVVFSSSDLYAKCTGVAIFSLLRTNVDLPELKIFLITTDMTIKNQEKIKRMCNDFNRNIEIVEASEVLNKAQIDLCLSSFKGGLNTYARAVANKVLPEDVDRALFVDSDILFNGSLSFLDSLSMEDNVVAGVPEIMLMTKSVCYEDVELLNKCDPYLNYGVVLIDLKNWRKFKGDDMIKNCVLSHNKQFRIAEQSIMNFTFRKHSMVLPVQYNYYTVLHGAKYKEILHRYPRRKLFKEEELIAAESNPTIIHFVGDYFNRPWYKNNICRFKETYQKYYEASPWKDEELENEPTNVSFLFRIYYEVLKYLRKNKHDELYFLIRYIWIQWLRERIPRIDSIKRNK